MDYDFLFKPENIDFTKFIKVIIDDKFFSKDGLFEYHLNYLLKLLIKKKKFYHKRVKGNFKISQYRV
ncbi:hypothetical protein J7J13_03000 [bacterium]|nr:hypothetical protein [bacterium]